MSGWLRQGLGPEYYPQMEKPFWIASFTHMFLEMFLLLQVALIPVFTKEFGLSLFEATLAVTVPTMVQLAVNIPAGILADRLKTRHLLFLSMMIEGGAALFLSQTSSYWALILGICVMRVSSPIYHVAGLSRISRLVSRGRLSRSMGLHNALGSLGSAVGTISLSFFLSTMGWRWTYLFWSLPIVVWGLFVLRSRDLDVEQETRTENHGPRASRLSIIMSAGFPVFLAFIGLRAVGVVGSTTFVPTFLVRERGVSEAVASLIFGLGPFMGIVGSLLGGYLGDRVGAKKILSLAVLGSALSLLCLALLTNIDSVVFTYLMFALCNNTIWSPMNTIVVDLVPVAERGLGFSMYFLTEGLVEAASPTIAVQVIGLSSVSTLFLFGVGLVLASLALLQRLQLRARSEKPDTDH